MSRWYITDRNKMGVKQIIETVDSEGYHVITVITDENNVGVRKYYYDHDKENAYEGAMKDALDQDRE